MITRIPVEKRDPDLTNRKVRELGMVPTIIYGPHFEPSKQMVVGSTALKKALEQRGEIFEVLIGENKYFVKMTELQTGPVSRSPLHLSLCELPQNSKIDLKVPLQIEGDPSDMSPGATILMIRDYINLRGRLNEIPESVTVHVSSLKPGDNIKVRDLELNAAIELMDSEDDVLIVCQHPHLQNVEEKEAPTLISDTDTSVSLR